MPSNVDRLNQRAQNLVLRLLEQLAEIIAAVLRWLDVKDLLHLRVSCGRLHSLVHDLEQSLCIAYSGHLKHEYVVFKVQTHILAQRPDLMSYIELQHRHSCIWQLSGVLSNHVTSKLVLQSTTGKEAEAGFRIRKAGAFQKAFFPQLFMLNTFLESLREIMVDGDQAFADWDNDAYLSAYDVFLLDQQYLVGSLCDSAATILGISAAHSVLIGVCRANSLGSRARAPSYPFASVKRILLMCGLIPFAALLEEGRDQAARIATLGCASEALLRLYRPKRHDYPLRSIHHLDVGRYCLPEPQSQRPCKVIEKFLERQDVWQKAAFAVLQRDFAYEPDQLSDSADSWILDAIAEPADIVYSLNDWRTP